MSKQVGNYFWTKIKDNYYINDSKCSSSHSEKVFSYTSLLSNSLIHGDPNTWEKSEKNHEKKL
jgi:hypothetical protein